MSDFDSLDHSPAPVVTELYSVKRHGATITIATPSWYRPQVPFRLTERFWSSGSLTWFFQASENTGEILGCAARALLGRSSRAVMGPGGKDRLEALLAREPTESHPLYVFTLPARGGVPPLEVTAHTREGVAVVQFEPVCLTEPAPPG